METLLDLQLKGTFLKNVLDALTDMFSEVNFEFSGTGCEIQAVDTSGVVLLSIFLRRDSFAQYNYSRYISIGLKVADMEDLRSANKNNNDEVLIKVDMPNALDFTIKSENGLITYYKFDVYDIDCMPLEIEEPSESKYQAIVRLSCSDFMNICKKLSMFGDYEGLDTVVGITVNKEGIRFFTVGKNGTSEILCPPNDSTYIDMKEDVFLKYALGYITSFSKLSTMSDQVTISLASKKPAVFEYEIAGMGYIRYYILPLSNEMQN